MHGSYKLESQNIYGNVFPEKCVLQGNYSNHNCVKNNCMRLLPHHSRLGNRTAGQLCCFFPTVFK